MPTGGERVDDEYAARKFARLLGNRIARDGDKVYVFDDDTGLWDPSPTAYRKALASVKSDMQLGPVGMETNYGGSEAKAKSLYPWLTAAVPDTQFISKDADTSYGKLLFQDGVYDAITGTFTEAFDPKILFLKRINRPFPKFKDEAKIKEVNTVLFEAGFSDETGEYLKRALAVALTGDGHRKCYYECLGDSNCGKGVLVTGIRAAFDGYVAESGANCLMYNKNNGQDEARTLGFVAAFEGARVAFSSEMRMMDGMARDANLLKSLSSGGDELQIRGIYEKDRPFVNKSVMFLMANDLPPCVPESDAVRDRCRVIRYKYHFVPEPAAPDEKKADLAIKDRLKTAEYADALFWLLMDTYRALPEVERCRGGKLAEPQCVIVDTKEIYEVEEGEISKALRLQFTVTNDPNDKAVSSDIIDHLVAQGLEAHFSRNKLSREVTKLISLPAGIARDVTLPGADGMPVKYRRGIRSRFDTSDVAAAKKSRFKSDPF